MKHYPKWHGHLPCDGGEGIKNLSLRFSLLFLLLSMICFKVYAYDFEVNGIYYNIVSFDDLTCEITQKNNTSSVYTGDFVIPSEVQYNGKTLKVVKIGRRAFEGSSITSVHIPNTVTSIGEYAFWNCDKLTVFPVGNCIASIGERAFFNCGFTTVNIPNSITEIKSHTFENCSNLISVVLPLSIEKIGYFAFYNTRLKSIKVPSKCKEIGAAAFSCGSSPGADYRCPITDIIFEEGEDVLNVHYGNHRRESGNEIYYGMFQYMPLKNLYIGRKIEWDEGPDPGGYRQYYRSAFENSLESIVIGDNLVGEDLKILGLSGQNNLTHITFGTRIDNIGSMENCVKLESIVVKSKNPPSAKGFANTTYLHCKLYVPKGSKAAYESANVWRNFWNIIELNQDVNALENVSFGTIETIRYAIDGTKLSLPQRGINIIKMSDGTTKKVIVK